jgi:hypothetical protein
VLRTVEVGVGEAGVGARVRLEGDEAHDLRMVLTREGTRLHEGVPGKVLLPLDGPGDYHLDIVADGRVLATRGVMARTLECAGGKKRLDAHVVRAAHVSPGQYARLFLTVPRWNPNDRDAAYFVEWVQGGKVAFEDRGRHAYFDAAANVAETTRNLEGYDAICSFTFGEDYATPERKDFAEGSEWEVRVHREGQPSIAATFRVQKNEALGDVDFDLAFHEIPTPDSVKAIWARIPSACQRRCSAVGGSLPALPGHYRSRLVEDGIFTRPQCQEHVPVLPHMAHATTAGASLPIPLVFSPEELRAIVRDKQVVALRLALDRAFWDDHDDFGIDRPDFEYDPNQGPDANFQRRRAWEAQDFALQKAQEARGQARAAALAPPLARLVAQDGKAPFAGDETPAPQEAPAASE